MPSCMRVRPRRKRCGRRSEPPLWPLETVGQPLFPEQPSFRDVPMVNGMASRTAATFRLVTGSCPEGGMALLQVHPVVAFRTARIDAR